MITLLALISVSDLNSSALPLSTPSLASKSHLCSPILAEHSDDSLETIFLSILTEYGKSVNMMEWIILLRSILENDVPFNPLSTHKVSSVVWSSALAALLEEDIHWKTIQENVKALLLESTRALEKQANDKKNTQKLLTVDRRSSFSLRIPPKTDLSYGKGNLPWIKINDEPFVVYPTRGHQILKTSLITGRTFIVKNMTDFLRGPLTLFEYQGVPYALYNASTASKHRLECLKLTNGVAVRKWRIPVNSQPIQIFNSSGGLPQFWVDSIDSVNAPTKVKVQFGNRRIQTLQKNEHSLGEMTTPFFEHQGRQLTLIKKSNDTDPSLSGLEIWDAQTRQKIRKIGPLKSTPEIKSASLVSIEGELSIATASVVSDTDGHGLTSSLVVNLIRSNDGSSVSTSIPLFDSLEKSFRPQIVPTANGFIVYSYQSNHQKIDSFFFSARFNRIQKED